MRLSLKFTLLACLACVAILPVSGADKVEDRVSTVQDNDADMLAAIAKARASLPDFWKAFEKPGPGESDFALKVKITDGSGSEHFWATDIQRKDGKIMATIGNDPSRVKTVKLGDRIQIKEADISDWMYLRRGKIVGNATVKALYKTMTREELAQVKSMMEEP